MVMKIENNYNYTFEISDIGIKEIISEYKNLKASINLKILGPNLQSLEKNGEHLYLETLDNKYLCRKEDE